MFGFDDISAGVGSLGAGLLGFLGQQKTNQQNVDIAASNNAWSAQQYATRYQTMTKDMMDAGLNPMLAYSQSAGQAPTAQAVQFQNPVSSAIDAYNVSRGTAAQATHHEASAAKAHAEIGQVEASVRKIEEETKNIPVERDRLRAVIVNLAESSAKMAQEGETQVSIRKQLAATIKKLKSETDLLNFDVNAALKADNFGREYKQYAPIIDLFKTFFAPRSGGITINK